MTIAQKIRMAYEKSQETCEGSLFVLQGPEGFFGGDSGGMHIWRPTPALAYKFESEEAAQSLAAMLEGTKPVPIRSGKWNMLVALGIAGKPVPPDLKAWAFECDDLKREIEKELEPFIIDMVRAGLLWGKGNRTEVRFNVVTCPMRDSENFPFITMTSEPMEADEAIEEAMLKHPFYTAELESCPVLVGPAYAGGGGCYTLKGENIVFDKGCLQPDRITLLAPLVVG